MNSNNAPYYHACGRISYELWLRHGALPTFQQGGELYVNLQRSVAEANAACGHDGLDALIMRASSELGLPEIAGTPHIDLSVQLRTIIKPKIGEGVSRIAQALAGYFPISGKRFRRVLLDAERELNEVYVFKFNLDGEPLSPIGSVPCSSGCSMEGHAIPLVGNGASRNAVEIPLARFINLCRAYERRQAVVPALRINHFVDFYHNPSYTRFFSGHG